MSKPNNHKRAGFPFSALALSQGSLLRVGVRPMTHRYSSARRDKEKQSGNSKGCADLDNVHF
jgi:hypothetical protein